MLSVVLNFHDAFRGNSKAILQKLSDWLRDLRIMLSFEGQSRRWGIFLGNGTRGGRRGRFK